MARHFSGPVIIPSHAAIPATLSWHRRDVNPFIPADGAISDTVVTAFVNASRWVVMCPHCASAQIASKTDRRFFCVDCLNEEADRKWMPVAWPDEQMVRNIEEVLSFRSNPETRSWNPGETIDDLERQNAEHGV